MLINEGHVRIAAGTMVSKAPSALRDFVSLFGISPKVVATIWNITSFDDDITLQHVLWALSFAKTYLTESVLVALAGGGVTRKTWRQKVWSVLESFKTKSRTMIRWMNRFKKDRGRTCKVSVDGTDFKVAKQTPHWRDKQYYSYKFNHAALRYEVAICIQTGDIVWINGPFRPGVWNDVMIFRRNLKGMLLPGEMVEADRGYRDSSCRHCDVVFSRSDARAKSRCMRRHETVNGDIKTFRCMYDQWRHPLDKHGVAFCACAFLVQMTYRVEGGPKFDVNY